MRTLVGWHVDAHYTKCAKPDRPSPLDKGWPMPERRYCRKCAEIKLHNTRNQRCCNDCRREMESAA